VRRLALSFLLLAAAGCNPSGAPIPCPEAAVARFQFTGTLTDVACASGGPAAGVNTLFPPSIVPFEAIISYTPGGAGAAVCPLNKRAEPFMGTHGGPGGDHVDVSLQTSSYVSDCGLCAAIDVQQVVGDLQRDQAGTPIAFTGTLVDTFTLDTSVAGATCAPCGTPCHGTYALTTLPLAN
jgi:hypothetical protein